MERLHRWIVLIVFATAVPCSFAEIPCPPMPTAVTDINRNFTAEIKAKIEPLGKIKLGEIGGKVEVVAKNLFDKYPNVDKLVALQMMTSTYCVMLRESKLAEREKLDRWENFQAKVLDLKSNPSVVSKPPRSTGKPRSGGGPPVPPPTFNAYIAPAPYPKDMVFAGIQWREEYVDVRVDVINGRSATDRLDFTVELDTYIDGIGQISQFPGVVAVPFGDAPTAWLNGLGENGTPSNIPISNFHGRKWRVQCSNIFPNTTIHLSIASVALNNIVDGKLPDKFFAPRRLPVQMNIKGLYEQHGSTKPVEFSYSFPQSLNQTQPDSVPQVMAVGATPLDNFSRPQSVRELFATDFPKLKRADLDILISLENGPQQTVKARFYLDFPEKVRFVGFFIPASDQTFEVSSKLVERVQTAWKDVKKNFSMKAYDAGGSNSIDDLIFSGRVFLYHESALTKKQQAALIDIYASRHLDANFRGGEYLESPQQLHSQYSVNVSDGTSMSMGVEATVTKKAEPSAESSEPEK